MVATHNAWAAAADTFVIADPAASYARPFDVLQDMTLTRTEKIEILHRWLMNVMTKVGGDKNGQIAAVTKALKFLGAPIRTD